MFPGLLELLLFTPEAQKRFSTIHKRIASQALNRERNLWLQMEFALGMVAAVVRHPDITGVAHG